jgi:8-oxo-dGTP diphosphatase
VALMDWSDWRAKERAVLTFVRDKGRVLVILKKRGLGTGKINGPGGRVEAGETWEQAAIRETSEETGITPSGLEAAAELRFQFVDGYSLDVRVFTAAAWSGTLTACDEADPFWQPETELPWHQMWADDSLWLPEVLAGRRVRAWFVFDGEAMREARVRLTAEAIGL